MRAIRACVALAALTSGVVVASAIPASADEPGAGASADASVDVAGVDANASLSASIGPIKAHADLSVIIGGLLDLSLVAHGKVG
jgi:hypothetical protein